MTGIGTIINTICIVAGGLVGNFIGKLFDKEQQDALTKICGISVLFIAIAGTMEGMLKIENNAVISTRAMLVVLCLAIGTALGELLRIERGLERFGEWLKKKTGNSDDKGFVNAFVTASLTVCIGAMAIIGAIQDGISNNYSTLAIKSVLDFIIIAIMTSSMGKGAAFSAIPILLFEGSITIMAVMIAPFMTELSVSYLSLIGSILIFCVGINLVWNTKLRVANMLPSVVLAILAAYLPYEL